MVVLEAWGRCLAQRRALGCTHMNGPTDVPKRLRPSLGAGSQHRTPQQPGKGSLSLKTHALLCKCCPLCSPLPASIPPPREVLGGGVRTGQSITVPQQRKSSSWGCVSPLRSPLMEGTLTPPPRADAAGAAQQSVHLPGAWVRMGLILSQRCVTLLWGDTACPRVGRGLPSLTTFQ